MNGFSVARTERWTSALAFAAMVFAAMPDHASAQAPAAPPAPAPAAEPPYVGYHFESAQVIPGPGLSWDLMTMDPIGRRVYIGRRLAGVTVIDADTRAVIEVQIPQTRGANGVAIANEFNRGFTSNNPTNDVTIFDLTTLRPVGRVAVGRAPDDIVYDPATRRVFTVNVGDTSLTLIDPAAGAVVGTVELRGEGAELAAVDGQGRAFIAMQDSDEVSVVDLRAMRTIAAWPTTGCEEPTAMAFEQGRLLIGCRGRAPVMLAMDANDGRVIARVPIGPGVDAIAFNRRDNLVITANGGDGTLSVIGQRSADRYELIETIGTRPLARTMALDPANGRIYVAAGEFIRPAVGRGERQYYVFIANTFTVLTYIRGPVD